MNKNKRVKVPVKQCDKTKKHKAHMKVRVLGAEPHVFWCPGKRK